MIHRVGAGVVLLLFVSASLAVARVFTGTFVFDDRPRSMAFLSLTETDRGVKGFLLMAEPNNSGTTFNRSVTVEGASDGKIVNLQTKTFLGFDDVTLTGHLSGDSLVLTFPSPSGHVESVRFLRGSEARYNGALADWQKELKQAYLKRREIENAAAMAADRARAARMAAADLRDGLIALVSGSHELHNSAMFTQELSACDSRFATLQAAVDQLNSRRLIFCAQIQDAIADLRDRLEDLRDARVSLEDRAKDVEGRVDETVRLRAKLEHQIVSLRIARSADLSVAVSEADASVLTEASSKALAEAGTQADAATVAIREARRKGNGLIKQAVDSVKESSGRYTNRPCLER